LLPFLAANAGFWLTALPLECILSRVLAASPSSTWRCFFQPVEWSSISRAQALTDTRSKITFGEQVRGAAVQICGPMAMVGASLSALAMPRLLPAPTERWPEWYAVAIGLLVMELVGDFALYWGHRVQHESNFLWRNFHRHHHQTHTPSPISTLYINGVDATLQATIPLLVAAISARPHPITFGLYTFLRVGENTLNHCGMDSPLLRALSLKFLPGRAAPSFHDYHHRFSNYAGQAKNYGENFWLWDVAFGTASGATKRV